MAAFARAVRTACRVEHRMTIDQLGRESGVGAARLYKLIACDADDPKRARLDEALSVWAILGERGALPCLALAGIEAPPETPPGRAVAMILEGLAVLGAAAADGRIDHTEALACERAAARVIEAARGFMGKGVAQ